MLKNGYDEVFGTWEVTTEGDVEGRTTKNLGNFTGYIDEIALDSMMERTALIINKPMSTKFHEDLGFSVVMNFIAQEKSSEDALTALLQLAALD